MMTVKGKLGIAKWIAPALLAGVMVACDGDRPPSSPTEALNGPTTPAGGEMAPPPPPPEGAFLAQLSPEQTNQLASLGLEVVVPGVVPPAFRVADLRISQGDGATGYIIIYQSADNQCFAVEFADGGLGDPPATKQRVPIQPPLFGDQGYGLNYGEFVDTEMRSQFPGNNLYTDWLMGAAGGYRLMGATYIQELFPALAACQDISPEVAVSLVESFTPLTADPLDLGK